MAENIENLEFQEISEIPVTENKEGFVAVGVDSAGEAKAYPLGNFKTADEVDSALKDKVDIKEMQDAKKEISTLKSTKAETVEVNTIKTDVSGVKSDIASLQANKLDKSDAANIQAAIKRYKTAVNNISELPKKDAVDEEGKPINEEGDGRKVINDKDENGNSYAWVWDGNSWSRTIFTTLPGNVATKDDLPYNKSTVANNQKLAVDANFILTIPSGMDIYDDKNNFIRLTKNYTCELHNGTSSIQYDPDADEFFSTQLAQGYRKNATLVGWYSGQDVQLSNSIGTVTQYDADGNVKNVLYRAIYEKDLLLNMSVGLSSRTNITITSNTITISKGQMYIQLGNGTSKTITLAEEYTYTFLFSAILVYNLGDNNIHLRDNQFGSTDKPRYNDIPLCIYDANAGICGGLLYQYWINIQVKKTDTFVWHRAFISGLPNFNVDLTTRKITLNNTSVDVYFGKTSFIRFSSSDFESTIDAAGTSRLWFNSKYKNGDENGNKSVFVSGGFLDGYFLLGTVVGGKIYPEGSNYTVNYSDGTTQKGACTNTFIKEVIQDSGGDVIPSFVMEEAKKTWKRFNEWAGSDDVVVFPIITDIHSAGRDTYKHLGYLSKVSKMFGFDFVLNNGDIGVGNANGTNTKDKALEFLSLFAIEHGKFDCPVLMGKGNHEQDSVDGLPLATSLLSNYLQKPSQRKHPQIHIEKDKMYGYMDIAAKKTRVIFLDSNDSNSDARTGYQYHKVQLEWLINVLSATPNDYMIIVASHRFPDQKGDWLSNGEVVDHTGRVKNEMTLKAILSTFIAKTSGVSYPDDALGLSWNFTNASGLIAGVICGDSHFDAETKIDGINIVCTQGYGGISELEKPPHAITTSFDPNSQMLIDVIGVKKDTREMKYFRMGAGGVDRDRPFTF